MKRYVYAAALCLIAGGMSACAAAKTAQETEKPQAAVDVPAKQQTQVRKQTPPANEITPADFKRAVQTAVRNMVRSGALDNPAGERYVVTISHIVDTTKRILIRRISNKSSARIWPPAGKSASFPPARKTCRPRLIFQAE